MQSKVSLYGFKALFLVQLLVAGVIFCYGQGNDMMLVREDINRLHLALEKRHWEMMDGNDEISLYESRGNDAFLIIANDGYRKYVMNSILAYSETNGFRGTESIWKRDLIQFYSRQLRLLKERGKIKEARKLPFRFEKIQHADVLPLLKSVWGQDYPYNEHCPTTVNATTHNLTGCVATALSQIMYYYKYPAKGTGVFESGNKGGSYMINFDRQIINWNDFMNSYPQVKTMGININPIAELMSVNAMAVSSRFDMYSTASNYLAARSILVNHWGYDPCCKFIKNTNISATCSVILDELENHRPVLLSGGHHAYICDGYRDGFYHLNLGWRGAANGYYRILLDDNLKDVILNDEIIKEVLFDIRPDNSGTTTDASRVVNVSVPGTLCTMLSAEEKRHIRRLTITGKLNGEDIALLRRMSGATDAWQEWFASVSRDEKWTGKLHELDLEQASFVKDNKYPFLRMCATEGRFTYGKKEFVISDKATPDYINMLKTPLSRGKGYRYMIYCGKPYIEFYTVPEMISPFMFYDCQNLKTIKLPKDTKWILGSAFQWCSSITSMALPPNVKYVESGAFRDCYLLTTVNIVSDITETCHNLFPYKVAGRYGENKDFLHKGIFENNNIYTCKGFVKGKEIVRTIGFKMVY